MKGRELRAAILLLLDERNRVDPSRTVDDTEIVEALGAPIDDVRRHLDTSGRLKNSDCNPPCQKGCFPPRLPFVGSAGGAPRIT